VDGKVRVRPGIKPAVNGKNNIPAGSGLGGEIDGCEFGASDVDTPTLLPV